MTSSSDQRFALLSVSDKTGVVELAKALASDGIHLLSTGGTASLLADAGLTVTEVAEHTGADEMMAGRVKTLHPTVHGGILGRRGTDDDVMRERGIARIDYVIVNLYPFAATVANPQVAFDDAIENIDIGGPAMLRSAAKNHASVTVVCNPNDYGRVIESLQQSPDEKARLRFDLAVTAFEHTAHYDSMIADWLGKRVPHAENTEVSHEQPSVFPRTWNRQYNLVQTLRYGENPHQNAAFYSDINPQPHTLAAAKLLQGKQISYNNMVDADAALACVRQFVQPACVIVKHANPCGVCEAESLDQAYEGAYRTDPTSAFGGIIALNGPLTAKLATSILSRQFVEVILTTDVDDACLAVCANYPNVRVLVCGVEAVDSKSDTTTNLTLKTVSGGLLVQSEDTHTITESDLTVVTARAPTDVEIRDLLFTWRVAKCVKSNAIVYGRDQATVGVGAGQMSRVYSARIAGIKAADENLPVAGSVMASDAFFPFRDGIDNAAEVGITAVIQPGGSKNDQQVIDAANEHNMAMVFTGVRHFNH